MKILKLNHKVLECVLMLLGFGVLAACDVATPVGTTTGGTPASNQVCGATTTGVNWNALMTQTCTKLSDYNLFANKSDPTKNPNSGGIPYDLSTPLFTDYASKYRFAFIPSGKKANYTKDEVLDFPVGTVLVKTFAMPANTSFRNGSELLIETRLLIHRDTGWVARPYYWDTASDASLAITGKSIPNMTTNHNGVNLNFTYEVPKASSCTSCHSVVPLLQGPTDKRQSIFKPIGPKARFLNKDYDYNGMVANQLDHWEQLGKLSNLPVNRALISKAPLFDDTMDFNSLTINQLNDSAKAYLDINCAHCHRSELSLPEPLYAGPAGGSGLQVEYNRPYADDPGKFGVCKVAVAGGHPNYSADVVPKNANDSYLLFRMMTTDKRHRMPELGRSAVHAEGVALIRRWINNLPPASCSPAP